jgi:hypothetical protein
VLVTATPGVLKNDGLMMVGNGPPLVGVKIAMSNPSFSSRPELQVNQPERYAARRAR